MHLEQVNPKYIALLTSISTQEECYISSILFPEMSGAKPNSRGGQELEDVGTASQPADCGSEHKGNLCKCVQMLGKTGFTRKYRNSELRGWEAFLAKCALQLQWLVQFPSPTGAFWCMNDAEV